MDGMPPRYCYFVLGRAVYDDDSTYTYFPSLFLKFNTPRFMMRCHDDVQHFTQCQLDLEEADMCHGATQKGVHWSILVGGPLGRGRTQPLQEVEPPRSGPMSPGRFSFMSPPSGCFAISRFHGRRPNTHCWYIAHQPTRKHLKADDACHAPVSPRE